MAEALQPDTRATPLAGLPPNATASASRLSASPMTVQAAADSRAFLAQHAAHARQAQATSGIPATFMVAQAALETGWGKHEIRFDDGRTSHNLFGIRAGDPLEGACGPKYGPPNLSMAQRKRYAGSFAPTAVTKSLSMTMPV